MLAAWLRARYPHVVTAALASSAPLQSTLVDGQGWDPSTFWEVRRSSREGGACLVGQAAQTGCVCHAEKRVHVRCPVCGTRLPSPGQPGLTLPALPSSSPPT